MVEERLKGMERALAEQHLSMSPKVVPMQQTLVQQLHECQELSAGIKNELRLKKPEILWQVESEVERNVAVSLASLSDTFAEMGTFVSETVDSNVKRIRRDLPGVQSRDYNAAVQKTKLLCKKCRYVICTDCADDLRFLRTDGHLSLWSVIGRKWESLSRKNVMHIRDNVITFGVNCRACDEPVAYEEIRSNTQTRLQFICSQILFQNKDGQLMGGDTFEPVRRRMGDIRELEPIQTSENSRVTLPSVAALYQQGTELNELLKKFQSDRQGLPFNQHIGSKPPHCYTKL